MADSGAPQEPRFVIPMPGGRVARVPLDLVVRHTEAGDTAHRRDADMEADDVIAHDLKPDPRTGEPDYHTDYEHGECVIEDSTGAPQRMIAWHRHPFGTEYAELFEG